MFSNLKPVWTAPEHEWIQRVFEICKPYLSETPAARTAPYMTDAANLLKVYAGAPTVVLGPGEAAMAHQTDEYVSQERIRQSVAIYESLIRDWCRQRVRNSATSEFLHPPDYVVLAEADARAAGELAGWRVDVLNRAVVHLDLEALQPRG